MASTEGQSNSYADFTGWEAKVAEKQRRCREAIPKEWLLPKTILSTLQQPLQSSPNKILELDIPRRSGILSKRELEITENYTVQALLKALAAGELTAVEVTVAFSKRAAIAQQLVRNTFELI